MHRTNITQMEEVRTERINNLRYHARHLSNRIHVNIVYYVNTNNKFIYSETINSYDKDRYVT
jgi:hypothetical protein